MKRTPAVGRTEVGRRVSESGVTLVELLVVLTIMSIVSAMLVGTWIALTNSYANTTRSSDARDYARQAASRMGREIRDAEAQIATGDHYRGLPAILSASADEIVFVTTFNGVDNDAPIAKPLAVKYVLTNGTLYMQRDTNDNGLWDEAPRSVVPYVVNSSNGPSPSGSTPVFSYTYIDDHGDFAQLPPSPTPTSAQLSRIVSVTFTLLVDLNPDHSPTYMNLTTTTQIRNQRRL